MKPRRRSWWSSASLLALLTTAPVSATANSLINTPTAATLVELLVDFSVNGLAGEGPVTLLSGPGNAFYASQPLIVACRLTKAPAPAFQRDGVQYYLLNAIPGMKLDFSEAEQTLAITLAPDLLEQTRLSYPDVALTDEVVGGNGGFLNYEVVAHVADSEIAIAGAFEASIFSRLGVGTIDFVGNWTPDFARLTRLATNWTIDDPADMRSLRLGDSISRGGVGGAPLRFGGIQLARNFAVQPGFVTIPLPSVRGVAALPSVVDVYVNGTRSDTRDLPPGPFQISEVPIVTGAGEVQLIVRDLLGRETLYSQSYYAAPTLLRGGLHDFSYEAGLLRRSFGLESNDYGAIMVSATHRYGFSDSISGEIHAEATRDVQILGVAAGAVLQRLGTFGVSVATSRSDRGPAAWARFDVERRSSGFSIGLSAEMSSNNYTSVGRGRGRLPPASVIHAFAGLPLGFGSLGISYLRRDGRGEPDAEYASASTSVRLGGRASLHVAARKSLTGDHDLAAQASLTLASGRRGNTSVGVSFADGKSGLTAAYEKYRPVGEGIGYRLASSLGRFDRLDASIAANTGFGTHDALLTWTDGRTGVRLSTAGGVGILSGSAFASRPVTQSFGRAQVGEFANVRVYVDNQLVGRTNRRGTLVLPRLRPFDRNLVRIELADLPWDAEVSRDEKSVRPFDRHGVLVNFNAKPASAAIIRVLLPDGSFLQAGSTVRLNGGGAAFISAPGGQVYLTGVEARNSALASWAGGSCGLQFDFTPSQEPQPRLGDVVCTSAVR